MVFLSTLSSFFHNLKGHLCHPLFPPQASQGGMFITSLSIASNEGHSEAARETSAWVLLKFGMFSCAATLLYPAGPSPSSPSPAPVLSLLHGPHQTLQTPACPCLDSCSCQCGGCGLPHALPHVPVPAVHSPVCMFQTVHTVCPGFSRGRCQDAAVQVSHTAAPQGADMDKRAENTICAGVWGEKKSEKGQTNTRPVKEEKCSSICFFPLCFPVPESGIKSINWQ